MLVYAIKINGTKQTGLIDVKTQKLFCLCDEEVGKQIVTAISKALKYDELADKITDWYKNPKKDLVDIGEATVTHFKL